MQKEKKKMSRSFVTGIVVLVFLIIGYQAALFIYRAAVVSIAANRDEPDTVYVCEQVPVPSLTQVRSSPSDKAEKTVSRKQSRHSPVAEAVRRNVPVKSVENFRFDPNTVSETDLLRLGFTLRQAQSIINYRAKGGRFRRKEDFAKSFVVADSVYRRLEDYIDIPLVDINVADSAAFDSLPGIGGWFASKMVEYRSRLGGYSYKEQLMDIWKFDKEKYDKLSDLITVSSENVRPYPIWTLPEDSLKMHPYIGDFRTAHSIVLFRDNNPRGAWTIAELERAGILSAEKASRLSRCLLEAP